MVTINRMLGGNFKINIPDDGNMDAEEPHVVQPIQLPANINDTLFCAAILTVSKKNVVIKAAWIKNFSLATYFNKGLKSSRNEIVFYSKDIDNEAHFDGQMFYEYVENENGLYVAKIHRYFGKQLFIEVYRLHVFIFLVAV